MSSFSKLAGSNGVPFGVVEFANKPDPFTGDDMNLVKSLAALVGLCLDMRDMETISEHGNVEFEMERWIDTSERQEAVIPAKLAPVTAERIELKSLQFNIHNWQGMNLFKAVFVLFDSFNLMKTFNIASETLFSFLYALREKHNDVAHHNWQHAVDVLQTVSYICSVTDISERITQHDILALFIAALCQDLGHRGYGAAAVQTKTKPENERHSALTVTLLSDSNTNLLKNVGEEDAKSVWDLILRLISGTDMTYHYRLVDGANKLEEVNWCDHEQKVLAFMMILKGAVVGFMSKEARICDRTILMIQKEIAPDQTEDQQMKQVMAFGSLVAGPLFYAASSIISGMKIMEDGYRTNMERRKQTLYP